eukprot:757934-Hanusia_phi.AAC.4
MEHNKRNLNFEVSDVANILHTARFRSFEVSTKSRFQLKTERGNGGGSTKYDGGAEKSSGCRGGREFDA